MQCSSARGNLRVVKMGWGVAVRELRARKEASGGEETEQDVNWTNESERAGERWEGQGCSKAECSVHCNPMCTVHTTPAATCALTAAATYEIHLVHTEGSYIGFGTTAWQDNTKTKQLTSSFCTNWFFTWITSVQLPGKKALILQSHHHDRHSWIPPFLTQHQQGGAARAAEMGGFTFTMWGSPVQSKV